MAEDIRYSGEIDYADVQRTMQLAAEMNTGWHTEAEVREYLHRITGSDIPDTVRVFTPFTSTTAKAPPSAGTAS